MPRTWQGSMPVLPRQLWVPYSCCTLVWLCGVIWVGAPSSGLCSWSLRMRVVPWTESLLATLSTQKGEQELGVGSELPGSPTVPSSL